MYFVRPFDKKNAKVLVHVGNALFCPERVPPDLLVPSTIAMIRR
jgi:hypothetical protein